MNALRYLRVEAEILLRPAVGVLQSLDLFPIDLKRRRGGEREVRERGRIRRREKKRERGKAEGKREGG